jgi:NAD(P)-dependent dehydrogenase (short-subunit alcohol dehydrogenase family)
MEGQCCIVTGATAGIGLATAKALAQKGATVVLVGRDREKGLRQVGHIQETTGNAAVEFMLADLSRQDQIRRLAQEFQTRFPRLDVLVNNVGGFFMQRRLSTDGIEMTFALNYLGVFLLTRLLLDSLKKSAPSRIVNVSSDMYRREKIHFDNLELEVKYSGAVAYGRSKLALMLFTAELARRLEGAGVTVNALHPGFVATEIYNKGGGMLTWLGPLLTSLFKLTAKSPEEGAELSVYLASSPEVEGVSGKYFKEKQAAGEADAGYDRATARQLWGISSEMTGLSPLIVSG